MADIAAKQTDKSLQNMALAVLEIRRFLKDSENGITPEQLLTFLMNRVLLIYVATQALDDAFRLFTILNDRGVPLRNSDILKSMNLGELDAEKDKVKYAQLWEDAEGALGDDFDRFLNHIRTLLVKDKARLNVLQEFEHKLFSAVGSPPAPRFYADNHRADNGRLLCISAVRRGRWPSGHRCKYLSHRSFRRMPVGAEAVLRGFQVQRRYAPGTVRYAFGGAARLVPDSRASAHQAMPARARRARFPVCSHESDPSRKPLACF